jgi:hypothetical protein
MTTKLIELERHRVELLVAIDQLERRLSSPPAPYTTRDILRILNNSRATLRKLEYLIDSRKTNH